MLQRSINTLTSFSGIKDLILVRISL